LTIRSQNSLHWKVWGRSSWTDR